MIAVMIETQFDRLHERRREIIRTLDHVRCERQVVDQNRQWIGGAAYLKRCNLLESLMSWYADETRRLDAALQRISKGDYGICIRCHKPIDDRRLEAYPDTEVCAECQRAVATRRST